MAKVVGMKIQTRICSRHCDPDFTFCVINVKKMNFLESNRMHFFLVLHTLKHIKSQTIFKSSNRSPRNHFLKLDLNWVV